MAKVVPKLANAEIFKRLRLCPCTDPHTKCSLCVCVCGGGGFMSLSRYWSREYFLPAIQRGITGYSCEVTGPLVIYIMRVYVIVIIFNRLRFFSFARQPPRVCMQQLLCCPPAHLHAIEPTLESDRHERVAVPPGTIYVRYVLGRFHENF